MNPNNSMQSYAFQAGHQEVYTSPQPPKAASAKSTFMRISPWLAVTALLLTSITAFFAYYNWRDLELLEIEHHKLAAQVGHQRDAQEKFLSELIDLMAEQEKTHQYTLEELEKKMKNSLERQGYDASAFNSTSSSSVETSLLCRLVPLVSCLAVLLLWQQ